MAETSDETRFVGKRVKMLATDHAHWDESGTVVAVDDCQLCRDKKFDEPCGYPDLIVRLDDGTETRVYEPEAELTGPSAPEGET